MNKNSVSIGVFPIRFVVLDALPVWAQTAQASVHTEVESASVAAQTSASGNGASATLLPSGQLLLLGGQDAHGKIQNRAAIKDPATGVETPITGMHLARVYHSATVLPDGLVLVLGGIGADGKIVPQAELFDPQTKAFSEASSSPSARAFHTATLLTDGRLLVAGGVSAGNKLVRAIEIWDPRHPSKVSSAPELKTARRNHTATLLAAGRGPLFGSKAAPA